MSLSSRENNERIQLSFGDAYMIEAFEAARNNSRPARKLVGKDMDALDQPLPYLTATQPRPDPRLL